MAGTPLPVLQQLGGWRSLDMVMRYAHLAPGYVAAYAENATLAGLGTKAPTISTTSKINEDSRDEEKAPETIGIRGFKVGRCTGVEPVTPGITILSARRKRA